MPLTVESARSLFPHTSQGKIYLNHAGTSPLSTRVVAAMTAYLQDRSQGRIETYSHDLPMVAECKQLISRLVNAESPDRIALTPNTSDAINIVASGLRWQSGDRVLLNALEFPANVWPFLNLKRFGVEIDVAPSSDGRITPETLFSRITPRTRLVALSAVQFLSGFRADISTIGSMCRRHGIILAVDAIQAVGAVRLDVRSMSIDALSAGGQKWQTAPHGTGFLYITENLQDRLHQSSLGWLAVADPWKFYDYSQPLAPTARRFEGGSLVMPSLWGYHAALTTLMEVGPEAIEQQIRILTDRLLAGLERVPGLTVYTTPSPAERAGIATVRIPGSVDADALFRRLLSRYVHAAVREGMIRFSPHFYMTVEEMDRTVAALTESLSTP
jgi:selenocysteine lyase/cysteine desulfurase